MTLQRIAEFKAMALKPGTSPWALREAVCALALELERLMHEHAKLRESVYTEKQGPPQNCVVKAAIPQGENELARPVDFVRSEVTSAPMRIIRALTRYARSA